jgi:hypothetical protein
MFYSIMEQFIIQFSKEISYKVTEEETKIIIHLLSKLEN